MAEQREVKRGCEQILKICPQSHTSGLDNEMDGTCTGLGLNALWVSRKILQRTSDIHRQTYSISAFFVLISLSLQIAFF